MNQQEKKENAIREAARAIAQDGKVASYFAHAVNFVPDQNLEEAVIDHIHNLIRCKVEDFVAPKSINQEALQACRNVLASVLKCSSVSGWIGQRYPDLLRQVANAFKMSCEEVGAEQSGSATVGADDIWMLAARRLLANGELSRHLHARESATDSEHDEKLIKEENRVAQHVASLLRAYFPAPTVQHRRSIDEGDAAQLLAALVPHVERLIEADLRPKYPNIPVAGSLAIRAFTAERLLANNVDPTLPQEDERLLLLQNYLALHRAVSLLEAVERDPQCIWRIASGRAA